LVSRKDAIPFIKKILSLEINPSSLLKEQNKAPIKLSSDEALVLILDTDLTVAQYNSIKTKAKDKNADIFPNYDVLLVKKMLSHTFLCKCHRSLCFH